MPTSFALFQSTPDPFNPTTTLRFDLPVAAEVTLRVYDVFGHRVAALAERRRFEAGRHSLIFNAQRLPAGIYIYQIQANDYTSTRKMVLIK
jgi:Secretion system C-terminal sorting domain